MPRVGDAFCGGGSIPFEAARIGCEAFGSDLNPVAGLLTWASLNLIGGAVKVQEEVMRVQAEALAAADRQVSAGALSTIGTANALMPTSIALKLNRKAATTISRSLPVG